MSFVINESTYPLPSTASDLTYFKNSNWAKKCRTDRKNCFGILEKDKIVMHRWIEAGGFPRPAVHYAEYANDTSLDSLRSVLSELPGRFLVLKLTHLQSSLGVRLIPPFETLSDGDLERIWEWCLEGFASCFCCNLDQEHQTFRATLAQRSEFYRSIEPGLMIQDFYRSDPFSATFGEPKEVNAYMIGGEIISFKRAHRLTEEERSLALEVTRYLGADYIRVDMFRGKEGEGPALCEISLSPNRTRFGDEQLERFEDDLEAAKRVPTEVFPALQALCGRSPFRSYPITSYAYEAHVASQKRKLALRIETTRLLCAAGIANTKTNRFTVGKKKRKRLESTVGRFLFVHVALPWRVLKNRFKRNVLHKPLG